jgi:hypothetical protein
MNVSPYRPRKTKVMLEHELNEIYRSLLDGTSAQEIKGVMGEFVNRNITTIFSIVFVGIILAFNSCLIATSIKL